MVQVGDWVKVKLWGYYLVGFVEYVWDETVQITKVLRVAYGEVQRISSGPAFMMLVKWSHSQVTFIQKIYPC
ncbi:hypothetical protein NST81_01785 [Bacillus sp. FSL W8-0223]|uniref:hypothetical protein n=1 Tax=Bacillus sp. FSL W8-0223 TaxID=2954595 RepID=UPI0030F6EFFB